MQHKLKSVFRRSSESRRSTDNRDKLGSSTRHDEASPPRADRQRVSSDRHGRTSIGSSANGSAYTRSRPVSSVYDDNHQNHASARHASASDSASSTGSNGGTIANDYKAYLPVLSPVNDDHGDEYITLNGNSQHNARTSETRHEEDVADRNIARYSTSIDGGHRTTGGNMQSGSAGAATTASVSNPSAQAYSHKGSAGARTSGSALSYVPTGHPVGNHTLGGKVTASSGSVDSLPHSESSPFHQESWKRSTNPSETVCVEPEREIRMSEPSVNGNASRGAHGTHKAPRAHSGVPFASVDGMADGKETALARKLREEGVADLSNTVDTDGDITWAPAVTHEVIKPHQHEIVQEKIFREIHNYEYFHRIQPVMMTEVLPPRHWIPNPDGEGLIEISADELPARTGDNRWWSICEHSSLYSQQSTLPKYRTEPEIIEAGTFMTEQGFERRETIIIHPPKLADLTGYGGPVQAMHFDHKTGKSWIGELTTMAKLHELQRELDRAPDARAFEMGVLDKALPKIPSDSTPRIPSSIPLRKPVSGHSPTMHGSLVGRETNVV